MGALINIGYIILDVHVNLFLYMYTNILDVFVFSSLSLLSVFQVCGYRIKLHFDGYSDCYDFWVNADALDIHPVGWCEKTGHKLHPPKGIVTFLSHILNSAKMYFLTCLFGIFKNSDSMIIQRSPNSSLLSTMKNVC